MNLPHGIIRPHCRNRVTLERELACLGGREKEELAYKLGLCIVIFVSYMYFMILFPLSVCGKELSTADGTKDQADDTQLGENKMVW